MKLSRFLSTFRGAAVEWLDPDHRGHRLQRLSGMVRGVTERARREIRQPDQILEARLVKRIEHLEAASAELKLNEEALRERERRFQGMLHNISDLITVIGADGTVRYENDLAVERLLGYRPEDKVETTRPCGFSLTA